MSERKSTLERYRSYYFGDINALHTGFLSRFKGADVAQPLSLQSFACQNEIRAIIDKRIGLMPLEGVRLSVFSTQGKGEDETLTAWLNAWLEGPNFGEGRSFAEFAGEILQCMELDGETALKLILRGGHPLVRRIPDPELQIITDPDNVFDVTGYVATWSRSIEGENSQQQVQITERIDAKGYEIQNDGRHTRQPHKFGFIPVVLIKREDIEGSPHGRSGAADLIEPQDHVNRCLVNIARANKYGPWGLYCTEESGAVLPEGDVTVAPGSLVASPIRKVSGDGAADCLFREKEELLDAMYRVAGLSRNKADELARADRTSGKALILLNAQGKRYVSSILARLQRGFSRLCRYAMVMANHIQHEDQVRVLVDFPSLDAEDPAVGLERAKILFSTGYPNQALREMGYESDRIEQILCEKSASNPEPTSISKIDYDA